MKSELNSDPPWPCSSSCWVQLAVERQYTAWPLLRDEALGFTKQSLLQDEVHANFSLDPPRILCPALVLLTVVPITPVKRDSRVALVAATALLTTAIGT